jgi:hypothetical protein
MDGKKQANVRCGSCHAIPPAAPHPQATACGTCHPGFTSSAVNAGTHLNGRVDASMKCGSCHAMPPGSGEHAEHVKEGVSCGACHAGFTATAAGRGHLNGRVEITAPGWNASRRTCARACHEEERWDD